jgi:hypothetical protein
MISVIEVNNVNAFCLKVRIKKQVLHDKVANYLLEQLNETSSILSISQKISLHYAFAVLFERNKNYEKAYHHYTCANEKQLSRASFKVEDMTGYFNELISTFDQTYFNSLKSESLGFKNMVHEEDLKTLVPIFIVGQPRSGSTLLEQILIRHSEIDTAGELPWLAGDISRGVFQLTGIDFPKGVIKLSNEQCKQLSSHYLTSLQSISPSKKYIIDKMPANYQSLGLIKKLFPQAKFIHISRNKQDVSWSIFSNYFMSNEPYFCSLTEIDAYHLHYQNVMDHWLRMDPTFMHNISYEALVEEPEKEIEKVLSFCGLEYQVNCLDFNDDNRHIATLSDVQVRSGIVKDLPKKWLPYERFLPESFISS